MSGRLDKIEESQDPDAIKNAVDDYLAQNPVEAPVQSVNGQIGAVELTADDVGAISDETDPTVPDWAKQHTKPSYTAEEVGALPASTVIPTVPDNVSAFRNDAGYLTEHQDISGKLDASELPTAINTALAQAKASGEFDGADGKDGADGVGIQSVEQTVTSTEDVGTNVITVTKTDGTSSTFAVKNGSKGDPGAPGNDGHSPVVTATKSGKTTTISVDGADIATVEDGAPGAKGADGKSAYQYAVDGGYTGTEAEFTDKLAQEQLAGTTNELTPTQVYQAVSAGIPVKVQYFDETFGLFSYTNFNVGENINVIGANTIVYFYDTYTFGGLFGNISDNTWYFYTTALAKKSDIPSALPNPNALTFTGAVTGSYDGSTAKTVNIPSAVTDDHINSLIDTKLGVIENGAY